MDELPDEVLALIAGWLPLRDLVRGLARACRTLGGAAQREIRRERGECAAVRDLLRGRPYQVPIDPAVWGLSEVRPYAALAARVLPLLLVTADGLPGTMLRETFRVVELGARVVAGCALRSGTPRAVARLPMPRRVRMLAALDDFTPLPEAEPLALLRPGSRVRVTSGGDGDGCTRDYVFLPDPDRVALSLWCDEQGYVLVVTWHAIHIDAAHPDAVRLLARCRLLVEPTAYDPLDYSLMERVMYWSRFITGFDWFDTWNEHGRQRAIDAMLAHGLPVTALMCH